VVCPGKVPYLPALRVVKDAQGKDLPQPLTLRYPLSDGDCKRLIELGTLTPFGLGSEKKEDPKVSTTFFLPYDAFIRLSNPPWPDVFVFWCQVRLGYQMDAGQLSLEDSDFTATFSSSLASPTPPVATQHAELSLDCPSHHHAMGTEMRHIRNSLCPSADGLSAEVYKLVVYPEGGHFVLHRDTLRKPNHVGKKQFALKLDNGSVANVVVWRTCVCGCDSPH